MIFKVSEKFEGSCVLPTLNKSIWAGMNLSIGGNDLYAPDIKTAIQKGILISVDKKYNKEMAKIKPNIVVTNNTSKVLILGSKTLRPNGSLTINKDDEDMLAIESAAKNKLVNIATDKEKAKKILSKKKKDEKIESKKEEPFEKVEYVKPETGEDREPEAVVWNFKTKDTENAPKVPKVGEFTKFDKEENEDVDFIEEKEKPIKKKKKKKKKSKKKKAVKKATKKKGKAIKKKKVKSIEPVGEKKLPKTQVDAAIELDSRGKPIGEKPGEILQHLIDEVNNPGEVDFVDDEQALDRYKNRTDME